MSTAYHPQTDGQTERTNQEIEAYLRIYCGRNPENWTNHLTDIEFAHNQRTHTTTRQSPFSLIMGYNPLAIPQAAKPTQVPSVSQRLRELKGARAEALAAHELARQKMAERISRNFRPFQKGDKVWLEGKNLNTGDPYKKLKPKREGPFTITEVLSTWTYRLDLPPQWRIHPVFHTSLLSPYEENEAHGPSYTLPPPEEVEGQEEFEVEAILAHRGQGARRRYLIKWKGYPTSDNTWEPERNLTHAQETLESYKK